MKLSWDWIVEGVNLTCTSSVQGSLRCKLWNVLHKTLKEVTSLNRSQLFLVRTNSSWLVTNDLTSPCPSQPFWGLVHQPPLRWRSASEWQNTRVYRNMMTRPTTTPPEPRSSNLSLPQTLVPRHLRPVRVVVRLYLVTLHPSAPYIRAADYMNKVIGVSSANF